MTPCSDDTSGNPILQDRWTNMLDNMRTGDYLLHQLSVDLYNELGFCPLPNGESDISASTGGEVGAFFCDDHTHFDNPGAEAVAEVIADALVDQNIPLSAYLL